MIKSVKRNKGVTLLILLVIALVVLPFGLAFSQVDFGKREISGLGSFYASIASSAGLALAITMAFYGERIKRRMNVPDLHIVKIQCPDTMVNEHSKIMRPNNQPTRFRKGGKHYSQHLRVVNRKPWNPVEGCRVWLTEIQEPTGDGTWNSRNFRFAVNRLMKWAPAEFAPDRKMSFADEWVFDFGHTYYEADVNAFVLDVDQGGNFENMDRCELNQTRRFVFQIKAENCSIDTVFTVELTYTDSPNGKPEWWNQSERWTRFEVLNEKK